MTRQERIPEIALNAAWHAGDISDLLTTTDGETLRVIHRGTWTHGLGADFADAVLLFNDRELRSGSVEMHLETRGWQDHEHHLNPVYNSVILHVVSRHDGSPTRREDGRLVPVVEAGVPDSSHLQTALLDWDLVGDQVCAPRLAETSPDTLRRILFALGDTRLAARSARIEALLLEVPPAEVLWREVLSGLGYSRNQQPMCALAEILPIGAIEAARRAQVPSRQFNATLGLVLGAAGFLPLSPTEANLIQVGSQDLRSIEELWHSLGTPWHENRIDSTKWARARVRPANHPLPRLFAAAAIIQNSAVDGGLMQAILATIRSSDPPTNLRSLTRFGSMPGIGEDRAIEILASGVVPALLAVAAHTGDEVLTDRASRAWESLPASSLTSVTSRAMRQVSGSVRLSRIGARGSQGLVHLDTDLCLARRCFECPIAAAELRVNE